VAERAENEELAKKDPRYREYLETYVCPNYRNPNGSGRCSP
jgi:hypothetical protein